MKVFLQLPRDIPAHGVYTATGWLQRQVCDQAQFFFLTHAFHNSFLAAESLMQFFFSVLRASFAVNSWHFIRLFNQPVRLVVLLRGVRRADSSFSRCLATLLQM